MSSETAKKRAAGYPDLAVVIASHGRPLRLRWLLNALEEQTLAPERFEVVVAHDSATDTRTLLESHPLTAAGRLRAQALAPGSGWAARLRNVAWRMARAQLILFTDDDCRPPEGWLQEALKAARSHPDAIVQGPTHPDPDELALLLHCPHARSLTIEPGGAWGQTCNILYPRELLERLGGFDESLRRAGEDTDLLARALDVGGRLTVAEQMLTYHCVEAGGLLGYVRSLGRWADIVPVIARHPALRGGLPLGIFWRPRHPWFLLALGGIGAGVLTGRAWPLAALAPWVTRALPAYGPGARGQLRALSELPGQAVVDAFELVTLARSSLRHRTLVL